MKLNLNSFYRVAIIVIFISSTSFTYSVSDIYLTKEGYSAATSEASFDEMMDYIADGDEIAFNHLIEKGEVINLRKGIEVYLVKYSWTKVVIRPKGYNFKLWTVSEAIERK